MNKVTHKTWYRLAGISGFLAVALGAFGAHALKADLVASNSIGIWETASHYHLIHAAAMLLSASIAPRRFPPALFFLVGTCFFSGSLYLMALTGIKILGAVTPIGGLFFLGGWLRLAFSGGSEKHDERVH